MMYRMHKLVKVIIYWNESDYQKYKAYQGWLKENDIYPASRGGGGSWQKNSWLYSIDDAKKIEQYLKELENSRRVEILPS